MDALQAKLDAGKAVDVADTQRVVTALAAVRDRCKSAATPAPSIELAIVERALSYECKHCGRLNDNLLRGEYEPAPEPKPLIDAEVVKPAPRAARKALAPPAPVHPNDKPRQHPGSIHDAPGARMTVLDYSPIPSEWP